MICIVGLDINGETFRDGGDDVHERALNGFLGCLDLGEGAVFDGLADVAEGLVSAGGGVDYGDVDVADAGFAEEGLDGFRGVFTRGVVVAVGEDDEFGFVVEKGGVAGGCVDDVADGVPEGGEAAAVGTADVGAEGAV